MTLSRRVFLAATGTAVLASPYPGLAATSLGGQSVRGPDARPLALLMMGHDHDPALSAGVSRAAGDFAIGPVEKPQDDDLYNWLQGQCDRLSGYRLAAMTDEVGALMLTMALRDRAAPVVLEGHHVPMPQHSTAMAHRLTFFGGVQDREALGLSLRLQGWAHADGTASGGLMTTSHHGAWAFDFGVALADAFAVPSMGLDERPGSRSTGGGRLGHPQASRSILADI